MKPILSTAILFLLLTSCIKTFENDGELGSVSEMDKLVVLDGFNYVNNYETSIDLYFEGNTEKVYFDLLNGTIENGASVLFNDVFTSNYHKEISLPLHITQLSLIARYANRIKVFQLKASDGFRLDLMTDSFVATIDTTQATNGRVGGIEDPNCLPSEIGVYFTEDLIWSNAYIAAYSSKSISNVVIRYDDGSEIEIKDPDLDYKNIWYIKVDQSKQIVGVWIKSGCNSGADGSKNGWYIKNPNYQEVIDTDKDGVEDALDADLYDPNIAKITYYPAEDEYTTYAFEDLWPYQGDFDFNDFVISSNEIIYSNALDRVTKVKFEFLIRGIGASFSNDFCVSLSDPNNTATISLVTTDHLVMERVAMENNTEIRFPAIKDIFGSVGFVNTQPDKTVLDVKSFSLTILLDGSVPYSSFETDQYLRIDQEEGREVHLPGKAPTPLADITMFQSGHDDTNPENNKYYLTKNNLPWVIEVPYDWAYPSEGSLILEAYPKFKEFAEGNSIDWYTQKTGNIIEEYIF